MHSCVLVTTWTRRYARNVVVLHVLVPPHLQRYLGLSQRPGEALGESQIRRSLLEAGEFDFELAGRGRAMRRIDGEDAGPCSLLVPRLGNARLRERQSRLTDLLSNIWRRAKRRQASG